MWTPQIVNGVPRLAPGGAPKLVYTVPKGGVCSSTPLSLPFGMRFKKLKIQLGENKLVFLLDFVYIGSAPYSSFMLTFDLKPAERLYVVAE